MYMYMYMQIYIYIYIYVVAATAQWVGRQARVAKVPGSSPAIVTERVRRQTFQSLWRKSFAPGANTGHTGQELVGKTR